MTFIKRILFLAAGIGVFERNIPQINLVTNL